MSSATTYLKTNDLKTMINVPVAKGTLLETKQGLYWFPRDSSVTRIKLFSGKPSPVRTVANLIEKYVVQSAIVIDFIKFFSTITRGCVFYAGTVIVRDNVYYVVLKQTSPTWEHSAISLNDTEYWNRYFDDEVRKGNFSRTTAN